MKVAYTVATSQICEPTNAASSHYTGMESYCTSSHTQMLRSTKGTSSYLLIQLLPIQAVGLTSKPPQMKCSLNAIVMKDVSGFER